MALDPDFIRDLFARFRPVELRRMFGGAGLYANGVMFGLVIRDAIYLKTDNAAAHDFAREGSAPFSFTRGGRTVATSYWRLPERLYDDPDELSAWAARALVVAARKPPKQPQRQRRRVRG